MFVLFRFGLGIVCLFACLFFESGALILILTHYIVALTPVSPSCSLKALGLQACSTMQIEICSTELLKYVCAYVGGSGGYITPLTQRFYILNYLTISWSFPPRGFVTKYHNSVK